MSDGERMSARDERTRGVLEVVTAILLGLVSVATAFGAYQAGQWAQQATDLAGASQQARDRNLSLFLESEIISGDDGQRVFDALGLYAQMTFYPERTEALTAEQNLVISAASQPLVDLFPAWRDAGYPPDQIPLVSPEYQSLTFAPAQSYNIVSAVADRSSRALEARSHTMTIVSVVFALALLMLGVAGVSQRIRLSAVMTGTGAAAFLAGVAIVIFGIY
jgi:pyruvate/oxaloacetate carboxyltransferase